MRYAHAIFLFVEAKSEYRVNQRVTPSRAAFRGTSLQSTHTPSCFNSVRDVARRGKPLGGIANSMSRDAFLFDHIEYKLILEQVETPS
eukprot:gene5483-5567_t